MLMPTEWKMSLKQFNKNVSTLKFVKRAQTPAYLKSTFTFLDNFFNCTGRGTSVGVEIFAGMVNFFSCMYILAAIPVFMKNAGYNADNALAIISLGCGLANIVSGCVSNLPIIISPPVPISIYFASTVAQSTMSVHQGNMAVFYSGISFLIMAVVAPIGRFMARVIPEYIQLSTTIGIGLFTVLYGFVDLGLVVQGKYTLLALGTIDSQVVIGISAVIIMAWGIIVKSKISLLSGLVWGTVLWWSSQRLWPNVWTSVPIFKADEVTSANDSQVISLVFELFILDLITCFGMCIALCKLGDILTKEGMVPNGRYLSIVVGLTNIFSGIMFGPPFVVSPESAAGIRAGAKTGLSTVVAGIMFLFTLFFGPFFSSIPPAGTSPILVMTGLLLVKNVQNIDFLSKYAVPAYMCMTLIPFTNSIFAGIGVGMVCYLVISIVTGQFVIDSKVFLNYYFPDCFHLDAEEKELLASGSSEGDPTDSNGDPLRAGLDSKEVKFKEPDVEDDGGAPVTSNPLNLDSSISGGGNNNVLGNSGFSSLGFNSSSHSDINTSSHHSMAGAGAGAGVGASAHGAGGGLGTSTHSTIATRARRGSSISEVRQFARRQSISMVVGLGDSEIGGEGTGTGLMLA